jgi:hypothetical protein
MLFEDAIRLFAVAGFHHLVAVPAKYVGQQAAHAVFVFHQQDSFAAGVEGPRWDSVIDRGSRGL